MFFEMKFTKERMLRRLLISSIQQTNPLLVEIGFFDGKFQFSWTDDQYSHS